jgi:hypothetical protein
MAIVDSIRRAYAALRDEIIFAKFYCCGLVIKGPDGKWNLTAKGRLELSKSPHRVPPAPPER